MTVLAIAFALFTWIALGDCLYFFVLALRRGPQVTDFVVVGFLGVLVCCMVSAVTMMNRRAWGRTLCLWSACLAAVTGAALGIGQGGIAIAVLYGVLSWGLVPAFVAFFVYLPTEDGHFRIRRATESDPRDASVN